MMTSKLHEFEKDIAAVINKHGLDAYSKMPDYILATYVTSCLAALKQANVQAAAHQMMEG